MEMNSNINIIQYIYIYNYNLNVRVGLVRNTLLSNCGPNHKRRIASVENKKKNIKFDVHLLTLFNNKWRLTYIHS